MPLFYRTAIPAIFISLTLCASASTQIFQTETAELVTEQGAGEGPAWHPKYGLFTSGHDGVYLRGLDGQSSLFLADAGTNGLMFDRDGRLIMCQPRYRRVSRMNLTNKEVTVLTERYRGERYNQPNDIAVDKKGRIYFSDPQYGARTGMEMKDDKGREIEGVYRIDLDGTVTRIVTHEVDRPNGLLITPDDKYLYVADNNNNSTGGARKLWRFDLQPDGSVSAANQKLVFDWKTARGPDGMAQDVSGRLYVAGGLSKAKPPHETAKQFKGGIYVFSPKGELLKFVAVPRDEVTNCAFGGEDLKTLFITAGGSLWQIRTNETGKAVWPSKGKKR